MQRNDDSNAPERKQPVATTNIGAQAGGPVDSSVKSCNTCGGSFTDASSYRNHFRYDKICGLYKFSIFIIILSYLILPYLLFSSLGVNGIDII